MSEELRLFWSLFPFSVAGGILIAATCAVLGVFVVLKRVVFIGITLTQVAAAGIAFAMFYHLPPLLGAALFTFVAVTLLSRPYESARVPRDAVLGAVFLFASALSILIVSKSGFGLTEVQALLYGDLILTSPADFQLLLMTLVPVLVLLACFFRPILVTFLDREQARVMRLRVTAWELLFFYLLGAAVSGASKVGGSLLVFCLLVVPPMIGLILAKRLWLAITIAVVSGSGGTAAGIYLSYRADLPTNQTIIALCCVLLALAAAASALTRQNAGAAAVNPDS